MAYAQPPHASPEGRRGEGQERPGDHREHPAAVALDAARRARGLDGRPEAVRLPPRRGGLQQRPVRAGPGDRGRARDEEGASHERRLPAPRGRAGSDEPAEAPLRLALKISLNVFVVSRVVSLAQPARALIDSSVNFLQPKIRSVFSSGSVATALIASSVSFSQFRTLSELREVQPAARALIDSSVRCLHRETSSEVKEPQPVAMAWIDASVRNLQSATLSEVRDGQLAATALIDSSVRSFPQYATFSD